MVINSTDMQNNFGKYLKLCQFEDIIVARNGINLAKLVSYSDYTDQYYDDSVVLEEALKYHSEKKKMEYEEFLELTKDSENQYEFIDGQIYLMSSPGVNHQLIQSKMFLKFGNYFKDKKCVPMVAPFDIILEKSNGNKNVVQPDIMVICDLEENTENDKYIGIPSLVVEILSKNNKRKDLILKLDLYMQAGLSEYWIVDPFNNHITVYQFENMDIKEMSIFKNKEVAKSFIFDDLIFEV